MASFDIPVGTVADATAGSSTVRGIVRFCGSTSFQTGRWVGMELSEPRGKNDGSVNGIRYFTCKPNYGIFVKFSQVTPVEAVVSETYEYTCLLMTPSSHRVLRLPNLPDLRACNCHVQTRGCPRHGNRRLNWSHRQSPLRSSHPQHHRRVQRLAESLYQLLERL